MDILQSQLPQESSLRVTAKIAYRLVRGSFRKIHALKNHIINLVDQPIIILLYHRVTDLPADPEMLAVSPHNFRQHVEYLKQHFRILRFEEEWFNEAEPAVAVTFDDGYADNVLEALPILEDVGVPATFFVSTGHIGTNKEFWWHELENILLREGVFPARFSLNDARHRQDWDTKTLEQRQVLYNTLITLMLRDTPERQEVWLDQLKQWAGPVDLKNEVHRSMTKDELKRLAASRWATIGAHTVTHPALSALSAEQQRKEIFTSKLALEEMTEKEIETFSYPFGRRKDYNRTSVRLCREAGFTRVAANFPGQVHKWTDTYQLPRHLVRNWDLDTFVSQMKSFWTR